LFEKEYDVLGTTLGIKLRHVINDMPRFLTEKKDDYSIFEGMAPWLNLQKIVTAELAFEKIVGYRGQRKPDDMVYDFLRRMSAMKNLDPGEPLAFSGELSPNIWLIG
jgi:hypothetical protein